MNESKHINPQFRHAGERALLIEFGDKLDLRVNNAVQLFDRALIADPVAGITDCCPTLRSLLVNFDPAIVGADELKLQLLQRIESADWLVAGSGCTFKRWKIPVCYGGEQGPDFAQVADRLQVSEQQLIAEHCGVVHKVLTLGFAPGFYYLGLLPDHWNIPRLETVKPNVPPGSVSVAVCQTVVTSTAVPTGWRTIGITPFNNFDPLASQPVKVLAGDEVVFYAIDQSELQAFRTRVLAGETVITSTPVSGTAA